MLMVYTIVYGISILFYYYRFNFIASGIMIALAIFLYYYEYKKNRKLINFKGLFVLGFIGGFGISLLKLSKLSNDYNIITIVAVYLPYFSFGLVEYFSNKYICDNSIIKNFCENSFYVKNENKFDIYFKIVNALFIITFISFVIEAYKLKFIPFFTVDVPHAYSTFHVFMLHYITMFYVFIPSFSICNYYFNKLSDSKINENYERNIKKANIYIIVSYAYVITMSLLLVSRSALIISVVISLFVVIIYRQILQEDKSENKVFLINKKDIISVFTLFLVFVILYVIITIERAHDVEYLNGIFEMKNEKMPIFITQPYMYISHNYENLNYMIENIKYFTFGRRSLMPYFTLTLIKKFFPLVTFSLDYVIKTELSTKTIIYDFYYDFGLVGVILCMGIVGFLGQIIEKIAYSVKKSNYFIVLYGLFCYYMIFSFFQTYFSLTDTWVDIIFIVIICLIVKFSNKSYNI